MDSSTITQFYIESHRIATEAHFIIQSLPNAELASVERIANQLDGIRRILLCIEDEHADPEEIEGLIDLDSLETFRQIFMHLEDMGLLDMECEVHRVCLFLVFQKRIQLSLDRTRDAWNHHKIRTEHNRTPVALFELSREKALRRGYWTGDPGDPIADVHNDPSYGVDDRAPPPPSEETRTDPSSRGEQPSVGDTDAERGAGVVLNSEDELERAKEILSDFDFDWDDGNWGIDVYIEAVSMYMSRLS
ncbi:hypothetical protein C8T65DRAFT_591476 [Cerioporus squamosus]|nr:hypothetical protein C8T65DRAFT_591476 [Cerioporus squamosus]